MKHSTRTALQLDELVQAVPGVTTLYPTAPAIVSAVTAVVDGLLHRDAPDLVTVNDGKAGVSVSVSIGVASEESAAAVCREVHDRILAHLVATKTAPVEAITVKVASIG